ncbi:hypothetical protein SAMN05443246_2412 [Paenibacillus sp. GP183]|nr:hypothetical protein SAMN05443246_2412 [Paenibacillus sp. GP183]
MDMNVYSMEKLMFQKQTEIEKSVSRAWQWHNARKNKNAFVIPNLFKIKKEQQTQLDVCCC